MKQIESPLISIIVPVYKVEAYLKRCVDSVVSQSYENIEVILVDDGSPDKCGEMCDQYAAEYSNVRVIHQENQGLSVARNTGIKESRGAYLGFVDSDDYIDSDMYKILYEAIRSSGADIAVGGIIDCYEETGVQEGQFDGETIVYDNVDAIRTVLVNKGNITAHVVTKLYKKEILEKNNFPIGKLYEDSFTIVDFLLATEKVAVVDKGVYYYCHRGDSIVESPFSKRDMHLAYAWERNQNVIMEKMPQLKEEIEFRYLWSCFYLLDKIYAKKQKHEEEAELIGILRKNCTSILKNGYFRKGRKIAAIALRINKLCYKILSKMQTRHTQR